MPDKFKNIFWHQGVKFYDPEEVEKAPGLLLKVDQLENDVTKNLLNVFEHTDRKVFEKFIELLNKKIGTISDVKRHLYFRDPVSFDFQIYEGENKFRKYQNKYLLVLKSRLTKDRKASGRDKKRKSIPDGVIHDGNTVILIEAKTQSPVDKSQLERHKDNFVPGANEIEFTWEDVYDLFRGMAPSLKEKDKFLVEQFCEFVEIIGMSSFCGFNQEDFYVLKFDKNAGKEVKEIREENLRLLRNKLKLLDLELRSKKYIEEPPYEPQFGVIREEIECLWFAHNYFEDRAHHTNLNFTLESDGFYIDVNAEVADSFRKFLANIKKQPNQLNSLLSGIPFDFEVAIWTKLPLQPEKANRFHWYLIDKITGKRNLDISKWIVDKVDDIKLNFNEYTRKMIEDCKLKKGEESIKWYVKNYVDGIKKVKRNGVKKLMRRRNPLSSCALRIRHVIPKDEILKMQKIEFLSRVSNVAGQFRQIIDFANAEAGKEKNEKSVFWRYS